MFRGYKKTSDGRTTSYFTREQSEREKSLIGDITPQRLDNSNNLNSPLSTNAGSLLHSQPSPSSVVDTKCGHGSSAWNKAGTWEEKDTTDWCLSQLKSRLKETTTLCKTTKTCFGLVVSVDDVTGDASVAITGNHKKKNYIFDFHCHVKFEIREIDSDEIIACGKFHLPDICSTHHEELEIVFKGYEKSPSSLEPTLGETNIETCKNQLASAIRESVKRWVVDFNQKY